jgi:outer membrane protein assembly factor BamB
MSSPASSRTYAPRQSRRPARSAGFVVAATLSGILPIGNAPAQATMFRGGPEHSGVYASSAPTLQALAWKFRTGGRVLSSPAVSGGMVYVGSSDMRLYAVDRATGAERWHFATQGAIASSPAVQDGRVFFSSVDGFVYALDAATGEERWRFATRGERRFTAPGIHGAIPRTERMPDPFDVFLSSPTVVGGIVYVGSGDQHVYALDAATGAVRWSFATGDVVHASPAVSGGVVFIGSWDRNRHHDLQPGRHRELGGRGRRHGVRGRARRALPRGGRRHRGAALEAQQSRWVDPNQVWTWDVTDIASPAVRDGVVYFPTSDGTRFKALDAATGAVRFDLENKAVSFSSPALVGDVAYYGTSDGWLQAVDLRTGETRAQFQTDGSRENGARWTDETGRLRTAGMYPDRTLDGMMIGMRTMFTVGSILSSPVVVDGVLYVGSTDGHLYALR